MVVAMTDTCFIRYVTLFRQYTDMNTQSGSLVVHLKDMFEEGTVVLYFILLDSSMSAFLMVTFTITLHYFCCIIHFYWSKHKLNCKIKFVKLSRQIR